MKLKTYNFITRSTPYNRLMNERNKIVNQHNFMFENLIEQDKFTNEKIDHLFKENLALRKEYHKLTGKIFDLSEVQ